MFDRWLIPNLSISDFSLRFLFAEYPIQYQDELKEEAKPFFGPFSWFPIQRTPLIFPISASLIVYQIYLHKWFLMASTHFRSSHRQTAEKFSRLIMRAKSRNNIFFKDIPANRIIIWNLFFSIALKDSRKWKEKVLFLIWLSKREKKCRQKRNGKREKWTETKLPSQFAWIPGFAFLFSMFIFNLSAMSDR